MNQTDTIEYRLADDYEFLFEKGFEVLGVFLFGSQNYQCDTPSSDIDVKAIVIPTFKQLVHGQSEIHKTFSRKNGELTVFDIHSIHRDLKKQNVNFLEILFTQYKIVNPKYIDTYQKMFNNREFIARMNEYAGVQCICGIVNNKKKKVFTEMPSNKYAIQLYGYDNKALADIFRLDNMLSRFVSMDPFSLYADCLVPTNKEFVVSLKKDGKILTADEAHEACDRVLKHVDELKACFESFYVPFENKKTSELIDSVTEAVIAQYIKEEL